MKFSMTYKYSILRHILQRSNQHALLRHKKFIQKIKTHVVIKLLKMEKKLPQQFVVLLKNKHTSQEKLCLHNLESFTL